jgi:hypothetical protein
LHRNVGLAGFRFRLPRKFDVSLDLESGRSDHIFNRTNLLDYTKLRARGKYQPRDYITITASVTLMDNQNPRPDINYNFRNLGYTFSASYAPNGGQRVSMSVDYSRADLTSDILFIIPQWLTPGQSNYVDDSHFGGFNLDLGLIHGSRLSLGYGIISTTGTHPLIYHQPRASLDIPITRRISWVNEWRYFDLNEMLYGFEKFHNNLITSGFRFSF